MKVIVIDNNTREIIIYTIDEDRLEWIEEEVKDLSEQIEDLLSEHHKLSEISWMILKHEFVIQFKNL